MTFTTAKITEMPLRTSLSSLSVFSSSSPYPKPSFHSLKSPFSSSSSSSIKKQNDAAWLTHWAPPPHSTVDLSKKVNQSNGPQRNNTTKPKNKTYNNNNNNKTKSQNAVERIVLRLRNLGLTPEEEQEEQQHDDENTSLRDDFDYETQNEQLVEGGGSGGGLGFSGEKLSDLLKREWIRPDTILSESDDDGSGGDGDDVALPWEREVEGVGEGGERSKGKRGVVVKAPTLAELTIEDEELRRLRRDGMYLRDRISVAKAGITKDVLEKIHDKWRKQELVRLKFHEVLARDMKTAHEITEVVKQSSLLLLCFGCLVGDDSCSEFVKCWFFVSIACQGLRIDQYDSLVTVVWEVPVPCLFVFLLVYLYSVSILLQ